MAQGRCWPPWPPPHRSERTRSTSDRGARPSWRWASTAPPADGCPIEAPDGLQFFIASNRPGTLGGLTTSGSPSAKGHRPSRGGCRETLGRPPVNSDSGGLLSDAPAGQLADVRGSERSGSETCGAGPGDRRHLPHAAAPPAERLAYSRPISVAARPATDPNFHGRRGIQPVRRSRSAVGTALFFSSTGLRRPRPGHLPLVEARGRDLRARRARSTS